MGIVAAAESVGRDRSYDIQRVDLVFHRHSPNETAEANSTKSDEGDWSRCLLRCFRTPNVIILCHKPNIYIRSANYTIVRHLHWHFFMGY